MAPFIRYDAIKTGIICDYLQCRVTVVECSQQEGGRSYEGPAQGTETTAYQVSSWQSTRGFPHKSSVLTMRTSVRIIEA